MTVEELKRAEASFRKASRRAEEARDVRNALVLEALTAGWSYGRIGAATGLSRTRIAQIAQILKENER